MNNFKTLIIINILLLVYSVDIGSLSAQDTAYLADIYYSDFMLSTTKEDSTVFVILTENYMQINNRYLYFFVEIPNSCHKSIENQDMFLSIYPYKDTLLLQKCEDVIISDSSTIMKLYTPISEQMLPCNHQLLVQDVRNDFVNLGNLLCDAIVVFFKNLESNKEIRLKCANGVHIIIDNQQKTKFKDNFCN